MCLRGNEINFNFDQISQGEKAVSRFLDTLYVAVNERLVSSSQNVRQVHPAGNNLCTRDTNQ